jgi:hypothetical protein
MGQYRVNVAFRGRLNFEVDAASEQEAEEAAMATWDDSPIRRNSDTSEILSLKVEPTGNGQPVREPAATTASRPARAVSQEAVIIETEAIPVGEPTIVDWDADVAVPTAKHQRSIWAYVWTAFWLAVLVGLAQLGSR